MDIALIKQYKRTVAVVKDLPHLLADNDKIWTWFQHYTKSDYNHVVELLKPSSKPEIKPVWNLSRSRGSCWGSTPVSEKNPLSGKAIEIRQNLMAGLEVAKLKSTIYDTAFLLAVTLIHELVHYIVYINKMPDDYEWGESFERESFGASINDNNASVYNHYQHSFINLKWEIRHDKIINDSNKY